MDVIWIVLVCPNASVLPCEVVNSQGSRPQHASFLYFSIQMLSQPHGLAFLNAIAIQNTPHISPLSPPHFGIAKSHSLYLFDGVLVLVSRWCPNSVYSNLVLTSWVFQLLSLFRKPTANSESVSPVLYSSLFHPALSLSSTGIFNTFQQRTRMRHDTSCWHA